MKLFVVILSAGIFSCSLEASWLDRKAEGWAWYEDKEKPAIETEKQEMQKTSQEQLAEAKKLLEEKLADAMIDPTNENLMSYMLEQKKWLQQSAKFAHVWEKVLLQNPELDPTIAHPVTHYGIQLKKEIDNENNRQFITKLSEENGLFFFYEGNSKMSQALAMVIKKFSEKYNWSVIAISVDGNTLNEFKNSKVDNGVSKKFGVSVFPALFVVDPKEQTATPVAYGFASLDQIENKILLQFKLTDEATDER